MRLISLGIENFRQHKSTSIEFLPGVTGIIGKNGSGKTTLLEAIAWALYGSSAVRGTNDTVRCRAAEGNTPVEVKLTFGLGQHVYTITRRLEPTGRSSAGLAVDGLPSRTGFKEVTESVAKLLGMDYQAFFTSFFTAQKELEFMRGMDGRERAKAISRMLGYERLVKARDRANQDRLGLQREIEGLERGLADPEEIKRRKQDAQAKVASAKKDVGEAEAREAAAAKEIERVKPERDLSEQRSKRHSELARRIDLDRAEEKRASERVKVLRSELDVLKASDEELAGLAPKIAEYRAAGEDYKKLAELQKHESRRGEIQGKLGAASADMAALDRRLKELSGAEEESEAAAKLVLDLDRQLGEVVTRIERDREVWSAARYRIESELGQATVERERVGGKRQAIEEAGLEGTCPTCERPLVEELPRVLAGFDDQLAKLDSKKSKLEKSLDGLKKEPDALAALVTLKDALDRQRQESLKRREEASGRAAELRRVRADLDAKRLAAASLQAELDGIPSGFDQARFHQLREIGDVLKPVWDRSIELKAALGRRDGLAADLKREQELLSRAKEEIETSLKAMEEIKFSQAEHEKVIVQFELASQSLGTSRIAVERARGDFRAADAELTAAVNDEQAYKSKEADLKDKRRSRLYLQTLAESFDRLRAELSSRTAPELAAAAGDLLSELTDGRYNTLDIDEDYEATVRDDGEPKKILSGGEEDVVNLSLRLAVSRMISDRAGQDLSLLVLDEVFGSLDDIRRENLVALLQTLKSRFEQIILITHIETIHDALDNCIWVDYDEPTGTSRVRVQVDVDDCVLTTDSTPS